MSEEPPYSPDRGTGARKRLLESIVGNANDAILVTEAGPIDEPGPRIVFVNESFTRTTGYTPQEVTGKTPRILQGPETDRKQLDKIRSALSKDEQVKVELLNYRKDGTEFWVEINIVPIADEHDQTTHYVSVQREITERKQTEQELRRTGRELAAIFESITDAFFSLDDKWRFTYLNSEAERVLERKKEELLGKNVWEEFPEAVGSTFYREYHRAVEEQISVTFETFYPPLEIWVEVKAYPSETGLSVYFRDISRRKRTEEELKESEERLRTILVQYASDIITITDAEGTITFESPAVEKVLGYQPEDLVGENVFDYIHPDDLEWLIREFAEFMNTREVGVPVQVRFRHADGSWRYLEAIGNNLLDDPDVRGIVVNSRDVTDRKRMEELLQQNEKRFRALVEYASDLITVVAPDGTILYESPSNRRVMGYEPEDLIGTNAFDKVHPDDLEKTQQVFGELLTDPASARLPVEYRYRDANGSWRCLEAVANNLVDDPTVQGVVVNSRDVTERKRSEEKLREAKARFRSAFDDVAVGMALTDPESQRYLQVNQAWCNILRYSEEDLLAKTFPELTHPEDLEATVDYARRARAGEIDSYQHEKRYVRADGHVVWALTSVSVVRDAENRPLYFVAQMQDITERKRVEENYRLIFENAVEGIYRTTPDGKLISANPSLAHIFGYGSPEEMIASLTDVAQSYVDPQRQEEFAGIMRENERVSGFEYRTYRKDGSIVWLSDSARMVRDEQGELLCYEGFIQDITARKQAEEELKENHDLLQSVMEGTTHAVFVKDLQGRYLMINQAGAEVIGMSVEEIIGKDDTELFATEDGREVMEADREIMLTSETRTNEETKTADGVTRTFFTTKGPYRNGSGEVAGMFGVARDITEIKRAAETLRRSESSLVAAQRIAHIGNWEYVVGEDLYWSDELFRIYGLTPQQFVPTYEDFTRTIHSDDRDYVEKVQKEVRKSGERTTIECRIVRPDGEVRVVQNSFEMEFDGTGELTRISGTVQDITERKGEERRQRAQHKVTRILAEASSLEDAIPEILQAICESLEWKVGGFWSLDHETEMLRCIQTWNVPTADFSEFVEVTHRTTFARGEGLPGRIWESGEPAWVPDVWEIDNFPRMPVAIKEGLHGGFGFPILLGSEVLGVMDFFCPEVRHPDEETIEMMASIGSQIGQFIERKRAQEALEEQRGFLREVIDTDPNLIFVKDWHGRFTLANKAVADIYGTTVENLVDKSDADFNVNEEEVESFLQADREVMKSLEQKFIPEERVSDSSTGEARWFQTVKTPLTSPANELPDEESRRLLGVATDITERKMLEERLEYQAFHDSLTDLPNRALFTDRLRHVLAGARRQGGRVAVLFLDLDNFKATNDSLGHEMGDKLLLSVAERLKKCLRPGDTVARFSGDEFTLLLENVTNVEEAERVAERILEELRYPISLNGQEVFATASIGIALSSLDTQQPEDLLRRADMAMYKAKNAGKAHHEVFDRSLEAPALKRLQLGYDLRRALERGEFRVYYQPIVGLDTSLQSYLRVSGSRAIVAPQVTRSSRIVGMEALLRWEHPERGLLLPNEFIPVAEESGMIVPIGRWVLEQACRQAHEWQQQYLGDPPLLVTVNLSAQQFQGDGVYEDIAQAVREVGMEPSGLGLEITENVVMGDAQSAVDTLHELKALGVKLIVDDFGVGYSSLSYLKKFPVDALKIDRSFTEGLRQDPQNQEVVTAVISLAHALNMEVVAEGIECATQGAQVQALGCEMGQGNYFSEPLPAEAASVLLAEAPRW